MSRRSNRRKPSIPYAGVAGAPSEAQKLYSGWVNPQTDVTVLAGATMFNRTIQAADVIGGNNAKTDVNGVETTPHLLRN